MSGYFVKNPGSSLDYTFDWGFQMLEGGETVSSDLGWSIDPDDSAIGGLRIDSTTSSPTTTTANLADGVAGSAYLVSSAILTNQARRIERSLIVRVAHI
ncbi:MAG: hypothetical protein AAF479_01845 [Pseudomonadota bacterium]